MLDATLPDAQPEAHPEGPGVVSEQPPVARVVHRTAERWRLRVPARKRDLPYFIGLYEALRAQPEIHEVTINPVTGSLLVWFAPADAAALPDALTRDGLLQLADRPEESAAAHAFHVSVNDTRILVFLIILALSAYQLSKKQFLAPALTLSLYLIDLVAGLKLERDAAARAEQAAGCLDEQVAEGAAERAAE
ncbi:hypothetical protein [Halochromatium sp.]